MTIGTVTVDHGELTYESEGDGPAVVFLHAGGLTLAQWDDQFTALEDSHRVVRFDARGHGDSSDPVPPHEFSHYEDLRQLLDALEIERATLVGSSLGSRTAADFALTYPGRVRGLVLASPGLSGMAFHDPVLLALFQEAMTSTVPGRVLEILQELWVDGPERLPGKPEQADPEIRARCAAMFAKTYSTHNPANQRLVAELDAVSRVAEIRARTLVVTGTLDWPDIHAIADLLTGQAPDAHHMSIPDTAHVLNMEQPARFSALLTDFLRDC